MNGRENVNMDNHDILNKLRKEIESCFRTAATEHEEGKDVEEGIQFRSAEVLIEAYNALIKLYYLPEYVERYSMENVEEEYRMYCLNKVLH